jgi:nucleoside triphosphate pyrophosphatase
MGGPPAVSSPSRTETVLASGSPRRHDLLSLLGLPFQVDPADIEEVPSLGEDGRAFAERSARDKALEVAGRYPDRPVLAADTVVELDGRILGKPGSAEAAADMLRTLSGRVHQVHTGAALVLRGRCTTLVDTATVRFRRLDEQAIAWYVGTGEPLDKAGAYAVQGRGGLFVARVGGSPSTVIGLPLHRLEELYSHLGLNFWDLVE